MTTNELEIKRARIERVVKVGGLVIFGFVVAPFTLIAIQGLAGLIAASVLALFAINLAPSVAVTFANWRLKALKAAASANPIETLENLYATKQTALLSIRSNITELNAVLLELWQNIEEHNRQFPGTPSRYIPQYEKLRRSVELRAKKYQQAQESLIQFERVIEQKRSDWKIALTLAKGSKLAQIGEDFQSKLLEDTALTTVQDSLNLSFAELETSLLDEPQQALPEGEAVVIEVLPARPDDLNLDSVPHSQKAEKPRKSKAL